MRVAIAFVLLAAAVAADAKPVDANSMDANSMDERASAQAIMYRLRGVGTCIAAHPPGPVHDPQDGFVAQNCQCAVDRFIAGRNPADLPSLRDNPKLIEETFAACRAERAGVQAPATGDDATVATAETARADSGEKDPEAAASPGLGEWLFRLDPVGWLGRSGLPTWAWAAIAGFGLLLVLAVRGRRPRGDLIAPPRSLRSSPRVNPVVDARGPDEDARPGG